MIRYGKVGVRSDGDYDYYIYQFRCDYCGKYAKANDYDDYFMSFNEAVTAKKNLGWKSIKRGDKWTDMCPNCLEKRRER